MQGVAPEEMEFFDAWSMLIRHQIWPVTGGLDAQSELFLEAVRVLDAEQARWEAIERSDDS